MSGVARFVYIGKHETGSDHGVPEFDAKRGCATGHRENEHG